MNFHINIQAYKHNKTTYTIHIITTLTKFHQCTKSPIYIVKYVTIHESQMHVLGHMFT